jgi:hypothetical protein
MHWLDYNLMVIDINRPERTPPPQVRFGSPHNFAIRCRNHGRPFVLVTSTLGSNDMLYALLCYHSEEVVFSWTKEQDDAVLAKLAVVQERLTKAGKLGPVARLMPTTAATTLRKDRGQPVVMDGPFAETKEQLLGFFIIDCVSLEEAIEISRELGEHNPGGAYEIRPLRAFFPAGRGSTPAGPGST